MAQSALRAAHESIDRFSTVLDTRVEDQVKVWVYQSTRDLSPAAQGNRNRDTVHLGQLAADDTVLASRDVDFLNTIRHEVAHAVTARATRGFLVDIPIWINEGLSTYAQSRLLESQESALGLAIQRNRMLPITGLTASARDSNDTVSIFYSQSYSIVKFLIETLGQDEFAEFIGAMRNDTMDGAMRKVYGFDQFGLEDRWRQSLGLPPASASGAGSSGSSGGQPLPTFVPFGAGGQPAPAATPVSGETGSGPSGVVDAEDGSSSALPLIGGGIAVVVLLGGGAVFYLYRQRAKAPPVT
jgi:hypothetical protein